jgi:DAK2 domain fusion protein YloV
MSEKITSQNINRRMFYERFPVDGQEVKNLVAASMAWLKTNMEIVNLLNVFPVPDGDTGTNMVLTMQSAFAEIENSPEAHIGKMFGMVAQGALMGARGNSGVILSQIWRGMASGLEHDQTLTAAGLVAGLIDARDTAYRGVVRPVEGTILTVIKDVAKESEIALKHTEDLSDMLEIAVKAAEESVERTPDLLPVLKDAGVVDSGGMGLFYLLEGMLRWINEESLDEPVTTVDKFKDLDIEAAMHEVEEGQDYEVVVDFHPGDDFVLEDFYANLEKMGTSIQVAEGSGLYRMHIHLPTENRYMPIDYCMDIGTITNVAIENLMIQMEDIAAQKEEKIELNSFEPGDIAVVTVSPGIGISKVFASLGVAAIVEGGQTMNPSTQDILASFENLPTNKVIILPNNKNIVMAAETAANTTVKEVRVVKSCTVPQGLAAMMRIAPHEDLDKVAKDMEEAMDEVITGELTTATRTVEIDGVEVKEGEIIALLDGKLVLSTQDLKTGCLELLNKIKIENYEIATLFFGNNIKQEDAEEIAGIIEEKHPDLEVEIQHGGQQHYQFIISIE